ncbi:MAG: c-type cytochrome biogenesis protein CcmI [Pseudomonadota bacterium]
MILTLVFASLTLFVVSALIWAAKRPRRGRDHATQALAIYKDQLGEVQRDLDRGLISEAESTAAITEIKRRMIKVGDKEDAVKRNSPAALFIAAGLVPIGAVVVYFVIGRPDMPSAPFAERVAQAEELEGLTDRLRRMLQDDPNGGETEGWRILATTSANQGWYDDALEAFRVLSTREDVRSEDLSRAAETAIIVLDGEVSEEARDWAERALALNPDNPAATYYVAYALRQQGDPGAGLNLLAERIARENEAAIWMAWFAELGQTLAQESGQEMFVLPGQAGPSQEDVEAAAELSDEDRAAMIQGMVDGLAARLKEEPEDVDGWLRLGRAYRVLGNLSDARASFAEVQRRTPSDDPRHIEAKAALADLQ